MSDHHETRCPMCGGSDEQGCYAGCPSDIIPKMQLDIDRLTAALAKAEVDAWNAAIEKAAQSAEDYMYAGGSISAIRALRKDTP